MKRSKFLVFISLLGVQLNTNAQSSEYEIATWEDFKKSAITFTFDDCLSNQYNTAAPIFDKYGYKASFYIVTNWINNGYSSAYTWANAKELYANGHEIGSHTVSHANLSSDTYIDEMSNSKTAIENNVGNICETIVYPNCVAPKSETECAKYYLGGRICNGQVEGSTPSNYFQIGSLICGSEGTYNSTATMTSAMQTAANKNGWCVFLIHEIDNGSGYSPLSSTVLSESLEYIYNNSSNYWVATFGNAIKYCKERNSAVVEELTNTSSKITLSVSIPESVSSSLPSNSELNYPLTIRRTLPSGWTEVSVTENGNVMDSYISDGYIYFKAMPNGTLTIEPSATEVLPTASFTNPASNSTWYADSTYSVSWNIDDNSGAILYWNYAGSNTATVSSASASSEWTNDEGTFSWSASNVLTEGSDSRWAASGSPYAGQWIMLTLPSATNIAGAKIDENVEFGSVSGFEIQYDNGDDNWTNAYTGTAIGENFSCQFNTVSAKRVRLYITSASNININYFGLTTPSKLALKSEITSSGSYNWTIPTEYEGLTGTLSLTSSRGTLLAESKTITIAKSANKSQATLSWEGGYTGPSCDEEGTGAYFTGEYRNLFVDVLGQTESAVQKKIDNLWSHFFTAGGTNSVYYEVDDDMAYIYDTGNEDVRTEGMSYGMMICVQLDHQTEFDKLWRWAKKYMQYQSGDWDGYFAWQCGTDGTVKGSSCAPDGEEYFITALLFASNRWGNDGDIDYNAEAQNILKKIQEKNGNGGVYSMFNKDNHIVTFVPYYSSADYSDPSYCLPAFLELWARWSDTNNDFWYEAADAARTLLKNSSNTTTGLFPDYCAFDGTPLKGDYAGYDTKRYQYDAIRCAMNVGMDFNWFRSDSANQNQMMTKLLTFFKNDSYTHSYFDWDGGNADGSYSQGIASANGVGCFAVSDQSLAKENLNKLWAMSAPTGQWRYYNGMVYMLGMLHASGNFKIYKPAPAIKDTTISGINSVEFAGKTYSKDTTLLLQLDCDYYNVKIAIETDTTSLQEYNAAELTVYPNPVKDIVILSCDAQIKHVELTDAAGNVVFKGKSSTINTSGLAKGIYILKAETENGKFIKKIIKD